MPKRKKRLEKGIKSIHKAIEIHKEKLKKAKELGLEELVEYFTKEISSLKSRKENRKEKLNK